MNDETAREKLAAAYSGCTPEVFADAPKEWRQAWYDDTEALLPVVREIVAEESREAATAWDEGHAVGWEHCQDGNYGNDYWDDDTPNPYRADALHPAPAS